MLITRAISFSITTAHVNKFSHLLASVRFNGLKERLFQEFPSIFFELIGEPPESANAYKFSSVEIKQTAYRIDGVFLPQQEDEYIIYFVEVQFQSDDEIYARLFSEICLYLRQNQPKNHWRAVEISLETGNLFPV